MVFSSPIFLFIFLPITLLTVLLIRNEFRNLVLLLASLIFYAWGESQLVVLMIVSIFFNYIFGLLIDKYTSPRSKKIILVLSVVFNLSLLAFYKYINFIVDNINAALLIYHLEPIELVPVKLPIGISFFTFQAMSYVIDIYRNETYARKNPIDIALYISLFPQLIAGPIIRFHDVAKQIVSRRMDIEKFSVGIQRFILGLGKKVIIANTTAQIVDKIFVLPTSRLNGAVSWLGIVLYALQIYFDFSGYSDMAIGLGKMFGFDFKENFNYPYISQSMKEFWRRWHISLSTWFRDYLYIPLGGSRKGNFFTYRNLLLVFFFTGLWHGASWNFIIWGLYHGFFLIIERLGFDRLLEKVWRPIRHMYALFFTLVGWVFFRAESLTHAVHYIKSMIGLGGGNYDYAYPMLYLNKEVIFVILAGLVFSTPLMPWIISRYNEVKKNSRFAPLISTGGRSLSLIGLLLILIISASALAAGTYNPFIYFRF